MDASHVRPISVQVAYALPDRQVVLTVEAPVGITVLGVIEMSGLLEIFPVIRLSAAQPVGIFGRVVPLDEPVRGGDRIEIYRPLAIDPRLRRRLKASVTDRPRGGRSGRRPES